MAVHFSELVFKRFDNDDEAQDYVQWGIGLIEQGCPNESAWELGGLFLDSFLDRNQVERMFLQCVKDLSLTFPVDWYAALIEYARYLCDSVLNGALSSQVLIDVFYDIWEDREVYLFGIWGDLAGDLWLLKNDSLEKLVNAELLSLEAETFSQLLAAQFLKLCEVDLPMRFPYVGFCETCGFVDVSLNDAPEELSFHTCTCCQGTKFLNMRRYENRETYLIKLSGNAQQKVKSN